MNKKAKKPKENTEKANGTGKHRKMGLAEYAFDSMEQFEAMAKIPKSIQQWAKGQGCPAFRHSRIYFLDFFIWLVVAQNGNNIMDYDGMSKEMQARLLKVKLDMELREVVPVKEAWACIQSISGICFGALRRMAQEFPKELEMRTKEQIKQRCDAVYNEIAERIEAEAEKLKK